MVRRPAIPEDIEDFRDVRWWRDETRAIQTALGGHPSTSPCAAVATPCAIDNANSVRTELHTGNTPVPDEWPTRGQNVPSRT